MELHDWIIDKNDLHYITKKQYKTIRRNGLKAVGDYLLSPRHQEERMVLGKSDYYTVYLCEWRGLLVAVKQLDLQQTNEPKARKLTQHLKDEIAILVKMHHPNIVQILGITLEPFQIVLEYFPLRDLIYFQSHQSWFSCRKFSASSYHTKYRWTSDLLLALIYLHERRPESVIHRDLKPSNVLITNDGSLKITDFGLSKLHTDYYEMLHSSGQALDTIGESSPMNRKFDTFEIGTYWYMSPELRNHIPYDNKMDIWSLGLILYEIWENRRVSSMVQAPEYLITYNSTRHSWIPFSYRTPPLLRAIILQCLDTNPAHRPTVRKILAQVCVLPKQRCIGWCF